MTKLPFEKINRKILMKKQATTSEKFGCSPNEQPVTELINYGIINIDKPKGPTKHVASEVPIRLQPMLKVY